MWIKEVLDRLDRKKVFIWFSEYAAKDKNLSILDTHYAERTVRAGKIDCLKSTEENERICFKNYFKDTGETHFVVVSYELDSIKIITVYKQKGKY